MTASYFNVPLKTASYVLSAIRDKGQINWCYLHDWSYVVEFLSSVTKTSEDKRMATDHCCLTSTVVLNMDENDDGYEIDRSNSSCL